MFDLITTGETKNGAPLTMSSREIAQLCEKRHDNVMRDIRAMLTEAYGEGGVLKFEGTYINAANLQEYPEFRLPRLETMLLVSGYSVTLRLRVLKRLEELESAVAKPAIAVPTTLAGALRLAAEQAEELERKQALIAEQQETLALAAPKVEFYDRYSDSGNAAGFRETCKSLKVNEARFREFLLAEGIMYRLGGRLMAMQHHIDAGRFVTVAGVSQRNEYAFTEAKFTRKGILWIAGEWAKYQVRTQQDVA